MKVFRTAEIMQSLDREVEDWGRALAQRVAGAVVLATPIGRPDLWQSPAPPGYQPGTARGNWRAALGRPATTTEQPTIDPAGARTIAAMERAIRNWNLDQVLVISNAADHIVPLDDGIASRQVSRNFIESAVRAGIASLASDRKELP